MIHAATHPPRPIKSHTQQLVPQTFMTDDEGLLIESSSGESEEGAPGKTQNTCKCAVEQPMGSPTYYIITFHINGDKHRLRERFSNIYNFYTALKKENLAILYRFEFAPKVWGAKKYSYPVIQHRKAKIAEFVTRLIDSDTCLTLPSVRTALGLV
ncbi:hypothetical protein SARC_06609 [Sphaeroforma arctica JP610]|uniref:PX domain-containing protein n=1 Tax=Sphaeroforma arctica JP610 TaxID=667725 RepID=A0A0L0FWN4_9EUKA|nr:hypothetical protein SARC_06609 [Sphaeroforma arctica JP610]KNC81049.1 hypothetical protein SARC_06609 [Sphaeroforma arctica JP610]|eukprot:XP_014154951.1 hypothetical protein SARC_06609 [Sphaeroforma arctica JP610]